MHNGDADVAHASDHYITVRFICKKCACVAPCAPDETANIVLHDVACGGTAISGRVHLDDLVVNLDSLRIEASESAPMFSVRNSSINADSRLLFNDHKLSAGRFRAFRQHTLVISCASGQLFISRDVKFRVLTRVLCPAVLKKAKPDANPQSAVATSLMAPVEAKSQKKRKPRRAKSIEKARGYIDLCIADEELGLSREFCEYLQQDSILVELEDNILFKCVCGYRKPLIVQTKETFTGHFGSGEHNKSEL